MNKVSEKTAVIRHKLRRQLWSVLGDKINLYNYESKLEFFMRSDRLDPQSGINTLEIVFHGGDPNTIHKDNG